MSVTQILEPAVHKAVFPQPIAIARLTLSGTWQGKLFFPAIVALFVALITYLPVKHTPQSCGLLSIEKYKDTYSKDYIEPHEQELATTQILLDYVLVNKLIGYIALANAFLYLVRYGVPDWAPTYLKKAKGFLLTETGWVNFQYGWAAIPGTLLCGWLSNKIFNGSRTPATIIYMMPVAIAVFVYRKNPAGHPLVDNIALIAIGFLIYGTVIQVCMHLILFPKKQQEQQLVLQAYLVI